MLLARVRHDVYHTPEYTGVDAQRINAIPEAFVAHDGDQFLFLPYLIRECHDIYSNASPSIVDVVSAYGYPGPLISGTCQGLPTSSRWQLIGSSKYCAAEAYVVCFCA